MLKRSTKQTNDGGQKTSVAVDPWRHLPSSVSERLMTITGHTADLDEALDEFENTKQAVGELFDENQALTILNRRLILTLSFATQAIDVIEREAQMFMSEKARKWIKQYREQMQKVEAARVKSIKEKPA